MAFIQAFRALRPASKLAESVASVPYDVINTQEARVLAEGKNYSFLHVVRPEIDLPEGTHPYADEVYAKAAENLERMVQDKVLIREAEPSVYLYRQIMNSHAQVGLVACCSVDEYDDDTIKKHEKTRQDKEDDRTRHVVTLRAHTGPVFLTYRSQAAIDHLVDQAIANLTPIYDLTAEDSVQHTVWRISDSSALQSAFASVEALYVADGHHRSASASRARSHCRADNENHTGEEEYNRFLAVLFPADQLKILPYNRVVHDLMGRSAKDFLEAVSEVMDVERSGKASPTRRGQISMYLEGEWWTLTVPSKLVDNPHPVESLDAAILQSTLLSPLLGIDDPRTSTRVDFVGGIRGTDTLADRVNSGEGAVAFSLYPVSVDQLMDVADAGMVLPPKSTWFEPKLRSGLFVHDF